MRKFYIQTKYVTAFILALLGVIITSPLMVAIALAIKIEDGGHVLFRQERTGLHGRKFMCYKFRSMKSEHVAYNKSKRVIKDNNPNLTKVGRVIRKFKLDELPQLFNILRGEMCFIGPRPLLPVYDCEYENWELAKFEVRPGLTGLGQVCGNGHLSIKARKYYDAYYVLHSSLLLDIKIVLKTVAVLLVGERRFLRRVKCEEYAALHEEIDRKLKISPETYKNFGIIAKDKADGTATEDGVTTDGRGGTTQNKTDGGADDGVGVTTGGTDSDTTQDGTDENTTDGTDEDTTDDADDVTTQNKTYGGDTPYGEVTDEEVPPPRKSLTIASYEQ